MFNVKLIVYPLVALLIGIAGVHAHANSTEALFEEEAIAGVVLDASNNDPVEGAEVKLERAEQSAETNADGEFKIENLEPGLYTLVVEAEGYETWTKDIDLTAQEAEIEIKLKPTE
jgi:uncharacterized membrane protein